METDKQGESHEEGHSEKEIDIEITKRQVQIDRERQR